MTRAASVPSIKYKNSSARSWARAPTLNPGGTTISNQDANDACWPKQPIRVPITPMRVHPVGLVPSNFKSAADVLTFGEVSIIGLA